ncbi:RimJ/RimL family protein N-acetyltransferase [Salinibacterium sp. CAN_S4]|uniref:GNAT family N-acetyltransferase n=1 Tax=Salinibacterium sp. CAN_S4 TaxID=2787727 RepID=UPI0018EF7BAF
MAEWASLAVELRPLRPGDALTIALWGTDATFCAQADWTPNVPVNERAKHIRDLLISPPKELLRLAAIQNSEVVGYADLHGDGPVRRELGFVVGDISRWGKGIGTAVASAALDYGFETLELEEIWAEAPDANRRSISILERIGLRETGRGNEAVFVGSPSFYRKFAITTRVWAAHK